MAEGTSTKNNAVRDWEHTPNLTPRDHEIKRDELYVLSGDTLIKAYHLLISQRISALQMVAKTTPLQVKEMEEYLSLTKYINSVLYNILNTVPLVNILQAQAEQAKSQDENLRKTPTSENAEEGISLKELLAKFHLTDGGTRDEIPPPSDKGEPHEETPVTD